MRNTEGWLGVWPCWRKSCVACWKATHNCGRKTPHCDGRTSNCVRRLSASSVSWPRPAKTFDFFQAAVQRSGQAAQASAEGWQEAKRGGQPGHAQHLRDEFPPEAIDRVVCYTLNCCSDCGGKLRPFENPASCCNRWKSRKRRPSSRNTEAGVLVPSLPQAALRPAAGSGREGGPFWAAADGPGGLHEGRLPRLVFHDPQVPPRRGAGEGLPRLPHQGDRQSE